MGFKLSSITNPVSNFVSQIPIVGKPAASIIQGATGVAGGFTDPLIGGASDIGKVNADLSLINKVGKDPTVTANQAALVEMMRKRAAGEQSLAAEQARATGQQNINQALAMAASARGVNPNQAFRAAQLQAGDMGAQTQQQASLARLAEMQQAAQLYGGAIGQQADYGQQMDQLRANQEIAQLNAQTGAATATQQGRMGIFSGLAGGAGTGLTMLAAGGSDEKIKKNINYDEKEVSKMFEKLKSATFEYKDKDEGKGKYAGVMAQDLEKSKVGKDMVMETPEGKHVDMNKMIFALVAQVNNMNKQLSKMNKR